MYLGCVTIPPMPRLSEKIAILIGLPEEKRKLVLDNLKANNPEGYEKLSQYFKLNRGAVDEALGYDHWLHKLGHQSFTIPFAPVHREFWKWNWEVLMKIRDGVELDPTDFVAFIPWSRDYGKSTVVEWAAIAEGAMLKGGYVIYVSGRQSQAEEHVVAIRNRIEDEGVAKLYPWLGKPKMGAHGNKFGWARDFLMTSGGWAIRPVGLDVAIRGGKVLNMRPSLLIFDDIDELGDSPYVVENKERTLTRSILPMGTDKTRVLVAQNPIHENSMVNRMLTHVSMALSKRRVFGPTPAMTNFAYEIRQTEDGPVPVITAGETTWPEKTKEMWEATLQRVGPESFQSEYLHDMTVAQEERVLPEYDDRVLRLHVITWSQFEAKYGHRRIPSDWPCDVGLDIGFTTGHKSAWTFLAKAPDAVALSGSIFRYRGRTFTGVGIDEQAVIIRSEMWPKEQIYRQFMSHEKLGERNVLAQKHNWGFHPCDSAKTAGIAQWRHFLQSDRSQPHPFHRDEKGVDGRWKLGRPAWFDIVDDRQFIAPIDDAGLKRHRDGAFNWRNVPVKLTDKGFTVEQPAKMDDDENDSTRMLTVGFGPVEQSMTPAQRLQKLIPEGYHKTELAARTDIDPNTRHLTGEMAEFLARKEMKQRLPKSKDEFGNVLSR